MTRLFLLSIAFTFSNHAFSQKFFVVDYISDADVKVFVVKQPSQTDLKVYREEIKSQAKGNKGVWYFTRIRSEADKKIIFVKYLSDADLKIHFVEYRSQAGWMNDEKKYLLEKQNF